MINGTIFSGTMSVFDLCHAAPSQQSRITDFIPKLVEYYHNGLFPVDRLMKVYPFEKINEAIAESTSDKCIKAVLRME